MLSIKQLGSNGEQRRSTPAHPLLVGLFVKQCRPALFQSRKHRTGHATRQQFRGGRLKPRLGRRTLAVEPFERLAPPAKLDGSQGGLRRRRHDFAKCIINAEQCV